MRNIALLLLLALCVAACGHRHNHIQPVSNATAFACPMDCEKGKTYPQAGSCPVCKMDLEGVATPASAAASQDSVPPTPAKILEQETMRIHDEAMAEMAEMNRVHRDMKEFMTRAKMTQEGLKKWRQALADIEKAEEGMMNWMAAYKDPAGQPEADALKYLREQKDKIAKNQADIRATTAEGKRLLGK
ncbi:MAG: heavy metal-binding domain-containing protein [Saprospiraceae bacterium]